MQNINEIGPRWIVVDRDKGADQGYVEIATYDDYLEAIEHYKICNKASLCNLLMEKN